MFLITISTSTMSIIIIFSLLTLRPHIDNFENRPKWLSVLLWHQHALVLCQTLLNCLLPPETCVSRIRWPWILNFALRLLILSKIRPLSIVVSLYCIEEAFWLERGIEHIEESLIASFRGGIESPHKGSVRLELGPNPKVWDEMDNHWLAGSWNHPFWQYLLYRFGQTYTSAIWTPSSKNTYVEIPFIPPAQINTK